MTSRIFSRAARARASARARVTLRQKIFIAFLDELDNSKHFEPYLFFGRFLIKSAVECGRTVQLQYGWVRPGAEVRKSSAECGNRLETLKVT